MELFEWVLCKDNHTRPALTLPDDYKMTITVI